MESNKDDYLLTLSCAHLRGVEHVELLDYLGDRYAAGEIRHFTMGFDAIVTVVVAHDAVETAVYLRLRWG